jgi:murein DD-endopeptidase MepM/ murein hydrolase activator NlpD
VSYKHRNDEAKSKKKRKIQFNKAVKREITAYFDHYFPQGTFVSYLGKKFKKKIGVTDCSPKKRCYDSHNGTDFSGLGDQDVYSVGHGKVIYTSSFDKETHLCTKSETTYGCILIIEYNHPDIENPLVGLYGHLEKIYVDAGDMVTPASVIGDMGATGCPGCGVHLHYGMLQATAVNAQGAQALKSLSAQPVETWEDFIRSLPPLPEALVGQSSQQALQSKALTIRPYCTYNAPYGVRYKFIDPFGWQKKKKVDPWNQSTNDAGEKIGCSTENYYLWKY